MRRPIVSTAAAAATVIATGLLASLGGAAAAAPSTTASGSSAGAPGWIVVLRDGTAPGRVAAEHSRRYDVQLGHVYRAALKGYSAHMSETAAARVAKDDRVLYVQADGVVQASAKPRPGGGGGGAQTTPTGVDRADADASPTALIDRADERVNVDVAVIDSGVDLDHADLNVATAKAQNCSTGSSADDGNGHGTHVAGTIGALDNANGVVGMAPGARIWPVRVLNNAGSGTWSDVVCGIDYVAAHAGEIEVANMSLGGTGTDDGRCGSTNNDAMHKAICNAVAAGVTFVVAAGNETDDAGNHIPAAYDEVITVSALADFDGLPGGRADATCRADEDDTFASFSNYGADIDLIAPGVCISSTWKGGGYKTISGTSMASPHVAGGAALYKVKNPSASPSQVKSALQSAGTLDWSNGDDHEGTKEKLLNVSTY